MGTPTISGLVALGKVSSERNNIDNNLITKAVPTASTDLTIQANIMGKLRTITIDGEKLGTEAEINVFIQSIESWLNSQGYLQFQSNKTYTDSFGNTYTVLADSFDWTRTNLNIGSINYTLTMKEGRTISTILLGTAGEEQS